MSWLGDLLGGGSKSSSSSTTSASSLTDSSSLTDTSAQTSQAQSKSEAGQVNPWEVTIPYLQEYLANLGAAPSAGVTPTQAEAYKALEASAREGNPYAGQISGIASNLMGTSDRTAGIDQAYGMLSGYLQPTASGAYLDVLSNPELQRMLQTVSNDVSSRINQQFAGAGRDLSGLNQKRVAEGVTAAQLPLLLDQYNKERERQTAAAQTLYGAKTGGIAAQSDLDAARAALLQSGVGLTEAAQAAKNQGANQLLQLEQQIKSLPYEDLSMLGQLLLPIAQLGKQTAATGEATATGEQTGTSATTGTSRTTGTSSTQGTSNTSNSPGLLGILGGLFG